VILEVGADARSVGNDWDAVLAQLLGRTDAGEEHELRRPDRAGGKYHLAATARTSHFAAAPPAHARSTTAFEHDGFDQAIGLEPQIGTP